MAALRKKSCIGLRGDVMGSKEKVASSASFHLISQGKMLCHRGVCSDGRFHQGKSILPGEKKLH